ncbi:TonB-dependent receptor [Novosphingobium beihaiensis]|uniref:TonB-dependent receptor n=1 Tax=Novosphingobium beihaiensis TaxID=2930389 RepID=A0ABT0BRB0_9SPHN|nr:TonB-dependent receptor [Novosphingobium beihaiensis]MCJ2187587.1 TonB-dependent receptor [Novosphingobium beihaiensis]
MKTLGRKFVYLCFSASLLAVAAGSEAQAASTPSQSAQNTQNGEADSREGDSLTSDIIVNGHIERTALEDERNATGTVDILSTGDIAISSNTGIADIARSLPGISSSYDQGANQTAVGEAQFVTIRGFDTSFNAYTLDGLRLPQVAGSSRAISLNLFSPFAIGNISADKTPGADQDSDSIAGTINLHTPTAFDFSGNFARVRALGQLAKLASDNHQPSLGGAIGIDAARKFGSNDQFGLYVATYYEKRSNAAESVAAQSGYVTTRQDAGRPRDNYDALSARGLQWNFFNDKIERYGATGSFDYHGDAAQLYLRMNYARYKNTNTMNQTSLRSELTDNADGSSQPNPNEASGGSGNYNADGVFVGTGVNPASYFRTEDTDQKLFSAQLGGEFELGGGFSAALEGAYAYGAYNQPNRIEAAWRGVGYGASGITVDQSDPRAPVAVMDAGATAYVSSLDLPTQYYVQQGWTYNSEDKKTVKGHLRWEGDGALRFIEAGGLYEDSNRDGRRVTPDDTRYKFSRPFDQKDVLGLSAAAFPGYTLTDFIGAYPVRPIRVLSRSAVEDEVAQYVTSPGGTASGVSQTTFDRGVTKSSESRTAVYANAKLQFGDLEAVPGIRYERNHFDASYFEGSSVSKDAPGAFVSSSRSYDHVDPSLLLAYRPNDRLVVRASVRSSYSRPGFSDLAGPTNYSFNGPNDELSDVVRPNPNLKPTSAWNFDLGFEYYGDVGQYVQVALYYKDLKNIIVPTASQNLNETANDSVTIYTPENGLGGSAKGVEISGRYTYHGDDGSFLNGFGVGGSITLQDTSAKYALSNADIRKTSLPQAPNIIYNANLFYTGGKFRANVNYHYTGRILATVQSNDPDIFIQPVGSLDLGAAYELTDNLEIGFSARNVLNEHAYWTTVGKSKQYISNDRNGGYLKTGSVYQVSATVKF